MKEHSDLKMFPGDDIIKMLDFLVDNIFVVFVGKYFQHTIGIPMDTNFAPLIADIFLYSYGAKFIVFALNGTETVSISVQSHLEIHRSCIQFSSEFESYLG